MLNIKAKNGGVAFEILNLVIDILHIVCKSFAKFYHKLVRPIVNNVNTPKYNNAFYIERPMSVLVIALIVNSKRNLIATFNRINLVTVLSTVEIYLIICFVKMKIDR